MKKRLLLSFLTVACCLCLIVGATLALFHSSNKVDIAVTSGSVNVEATVTDYATYSNGVQTEKGTFENGGTATVEGNKVVLDRISPMDKIVLTIAAENKSDIAYKYRMRLGGDAENALFAQLLVGVSEDGAQYDYYGNCVTAWQEGAAQENSTLYLSVELPEWVKSDAQGQSCVLTLAYEAVQGNAAVGDEASASRVHVVSSQEELEAAVSAAADGETIVLIGGEWAKASVAFNDAKSITVRGYKVGELTINAPLGTVHYYNDADTVIVEAVAGNSLHLYGEVGSLQLKNGRAVAEAGSAVGSVSAEPEKGQEAALEIKAGSGVQMIGTAPAEGAAALIVLEEGASVPVLSVQGAGETKLDNDGAVGEVTGEGSLVEGAVTLDSFLSKLEKTGKASLAADFVLPADIGNTGYWHNISEIDLNGYTMSVTPESSLNIADGQDLTIRNGTLQITMDTATIAALYVTSGGNLTLDGVIYNCNGTGVHTSGENAVTNIKNSVITATGYCVTTNAGDPANYGVTYNLEDSVFNAATGDGTSGTAILLNVPGQLNMKGCEVNGAFHGLVLRGGTAVIENSTLTNTVEGNTYLNYFDDRDWGSGNMVNLGALVLGNKYSGAYQYPTDCTLIGTKIESVGVYPAIYAIGNTGEGLGVTLTFGENVEVIGEIKVGNDAVTVHNAAAKVGGNVYLSFAEALVAANNGGTVQLLDGLQNVTASFGYTDDWSNMGVSSSDPNTYDKNYYSYTIKNVTIEGGNAPVKGLNLVCGKVSEQDPTDPSKDSYYTQIVIDGLTFKNIRFTDQVSLGCTTQGLSKTVGVTFDGCEFDMSASALRYKDAVSVKSAPGLSDGDVYLIDGFTVRNCSFVDCRRSVDLSNAKNVTIEGNGFVRCDYGVVIASVCGEILLKDNRIENGKQLADINTIANNYAANDYTSHTVVTGNTMIGMTEKNGYFCSARYDNGKAEGKSTYEIGGNYWGAADGVTAVQGFRIEATYGPSKAETIADAAPVTELV